MKAADIRKMSNDELAKKEKELREELGNLSFHHRIRPLENSARLRQIRKDIARISTIWSENISKLG
jgi:large subunit ribosomal protein L29